MSDTLNLSCSFQDQTNFKHLFSSLGWRDLKEEAAIKQLQKAQPFTFLMIPGANASEDLLLVFVDAMRKIRVKPIHIIEKHPNWKFANGVNRVYSNVKLLIAAMMDCSINNLRPLFD